MYRYDTFDRTLVAERVAQFRDQTRRFLAGGLSEDDFRPLRLQNGLYIQKYAPMLRISIPYGLLSTRQLRRLARIGRKYDRGYGHFTTRQNIQFNWPKLEDVPDILQELSEVEMHAIQTSGNCVRNITSDHFAGVAGDELADPRTVQRTGAPVGGAASGIRLPAAQVQDRDHCRGKPTVPRFRSTTSGCKSSGMRRARSVSGFSWAAAWDARQSSDM